MIVIFFCGFGRPCDSWGQIDVYGQVSPAFTRSTDVTPQLTVNAGRPTFLWRLDVLADAYIAENVTA